MFNFNNLVCVFFFFFPWQELEEIRRSGMKNFRNIQVEESNLLSWQGLIVPVSVTQYGWLFFFLLFFFLRWFAYSQQQFLVFLSCRITLLMTKAHSELKSFSQRSTPSNLLRSLLRQKSITPTSMRRARCACLWSAQRTGNLPPKLTKVGFCLFWVWVSFYVLSASRVDIYST